jgi:hypothetical protein
MTFHGVFPRANWGRRRQLSGPGIRWPFPVLGGHGGCCSLGAKRRCCAPIWQCVKTLYPCSSHQNSWGLLMFIPLKMVLIGIDPYPYDPICIICAPKLIAHDFSYGRTASNSCFFHVWAFRYTAPISRQKRWRSMFHTFLHGWRGTRIDLEITFDILWCKSSLCLRNMCLILWSWLGKYTCSTIFCTLIQPICQTYRIQHTVTALRLFL